VPTIFHALNRDWWAWRFAPWPTLRSCRSSMFSPADTSSTETFDLRSTAADAAEIQRLARDAIDTHHDQIGPPSLISCRIASSGAVLARSAGAA
jgi:hypothetical protein